MASSYTPTSVTQGFEAEITINKNFDDIKLAMDDMLNRAELLTANSMLIDLDMGGKRILNLPQATLSTEPVRFGQLNSTGIQDSVTIIPFSSSISIDVDTTTIARVTLTGNCTITMTGSPTDGQPLLLSLKQDATGSRIVTWEARFRSSVDMGNVDLSTIGLLTDYALFRYNDADDKWDALALNRGF